MKSAVLIALAALAAATPSRAASDESLRMQIAAATSVGQFIASQGNAALTAIRNEVQKDLIARFKLYLPQREEIAPEPATEPTPSL